MMGTSDGSVPGLYVLAADDLISMLNMYEDLELVLTFYEIYCGKLYDLLNNRKELQCREDGKQKINIIGSNKVKVTQVHEIMTVIQKGLNSRSCGTTGANAESSRSHAIL